MPTLGSELTPKQHEANELLASPARHILLRGGSRSGKTFLILRAIIIRGLKVPKSTHAVLRQHFNHLKPSIIFDTVPAVVETCFPGLNLHLDKSDWFHELPTGSRIWYGGLDDKERTEKVLGQEHSTLFLNECSQISYSARNKAITRLAQSSGLPLKAYYDCNPPSMGHWTYRLFMLKVEPTSGEALANPDGFATLQMNPSDNATNLSDDYIADLRSLPSKERRRFLEGEFLPQVEGALWTADGFKRIKAPENEDERQALIDRMQRIVVGVDPSGCAGPEDTRSDEIGIVVAGVDRNGDGFIFEDLTDHYSPKGWATAALTAYDRWQADTIVAERNFGGELVRSNIRSIREDAPVRVVTASRGKTQRAEPIAGLYEQTPDKPGRVFHVGRFPDLEDQLCNFSTAGYMGDRSPDRADAAIWALTELMLGKHADLPLVAPKVFS